MIPIVPQAIRVALRRRGLALREKDEGVDDLAVSFWPLMDLKPQAR